MLIEQRLLAQPQANLASIPGRQPGSLDLHADEVRPSAVTLFLQPIGEHQPRRIVVGVGDDEVEKALCLVVAHGQRSKMGSSCSATSVRVFPSAHPRDTCASLYCLQIASSASAAPNARR